MATMIAHDVECDCVLHQRNQQFLAKKAARYLQLGGLGNAEKLQEEAAVCHRKAWIRLAFLLDVEE